MKKILSAIFVICFLFTALVGCGKQKPYTKTDKNISITNVSYDATREMYEDYNKAFAAYWKKKTGQTVDIVMSHGGSGAQTRSVIEGNEADVVTLALAHDISRIQEQGLIKKNWTSDFKDDSSPYTSTIVFLVRKGNPKNIKDWDDLTKKEVGVISPNPKTSGGACWNFLAAWAYAQKTYPNQETKQKAFVKKLYQNVKVLDSGSRRATTTFVENGQGDVLVAWENEALISMEQNPGKYEIVYPSISILAQPSVAIVDEVTSERGTKEVSKAYLNYLYSKTGQNIIAKHYFRPVDQETLNQYKDTFQDNLNLVTVSSLGGWDNVYKQFFEDGAIFDQIYQP